MLTIHAPVIRHGIFLACAAFLLAAPMGARAGTSADDNLLYRMTAVTVMAHEQPASFAVWNREIATSAMTEARVPRHRAYGQFGRALPAMARRLERRLLGPAARPASAQNIASFDVPAAAPAFLGVVDLPWITTHLSANDTSRMILGFSRIAYDGANALLYAEACLATEEAACNGEAFWYRKTGSGWKLRQHVQLWGGGIKPFWRYTGE